MPRNTTDARNLDPAVEHTKQSFFPFIGRIVFKGVGKVRASSDTHGKVPLD
jgi:hypothetical protein